MRGVERGATARALLVILIAVLVTAPARAQQDVTVPDCTNSNECLPGVAAGLVRRTFAGPLTAGQVPQLRLPRCAPARGAGAMDHLSAEARDVACDPKQDVAQGVERPGWLELSVLGGLFGGGDLGDGTALMLTNQVPSSGTASLFTTSARVDAAPLLEGRLGVRLARNVWVEGGASYARPDFAVDIAGDIEGAPDVTAISTLTQLAVDGSLQYRWTRPGRRLAPFVMAGGGYLRQLDDSRLTAETGWLVQGGGGVFVRLSTRPGFLRRLAIRGDARAIWLRDAIVLNEQRSVTFTVSAGLTLHLGGGVKAVP